MKTAPAGSKAKKVNWIPWPDPIKESEVNIDLGAWTWAKRRDLRQKLPVSPLKNAYGPE